MKKQLSFIKNKERGFVLPYTLFLAVIVFILITSSVSIYLNELHVSYQLLEQLEIQTLFQMSHTRIREELPSVQEQSGWMDYSFPNGEVIVAFTVHEDSYVHLIFHLKTNKQTSSIIRSRIKLAGNVDTMEDNPD